ncbi:MULTISPECIES: DUF742 domain-containing protein [Nocardia]|uniref:DUF742 domain-containing protein n=4 Tax=Nocardia TaxID=1817 RepID=K0ESY4_NOCB7|nr:MULTISPECIES: DUF742 domain-containing protein [Nocardia]AFU00592.1 hypothetical protein O3I_013155 [Nocardia brasiliensis ATCC 700358]SUB40864.1 Protein of uncharacterised function (DUF742) [Nocardia brasiliensis]
MIPMNRMFGWFDPDRPGQPAPAEEVVDSDEQFVRPFVVTAGRTTPLVDGLRIETLVQAPPSALSAPLQFEQRTVVQLCQQPHSIAEIGTALRVPVGVAKVVVSDLAAAGYVTVRESDQLSTAAIERIRDLVRAL